MLALSLASCGGGSPTSPGSSADLAAGSTAIAADDIAVVALTVDSRSALRLEVNWAVSDNDVDVYLLRGSCARNDILGAMAACTMSANIIAAGTGTSRPETATAPAGEPGAYTLLFLNRGSVADVCTYRIVKT